MSELQRSLDERKVAIAVKLAAVVGDTHPRLADPGQRFSVGDVLASQLTYGQIARRKGDGFSPDLISGAVLCTDDEVQVSLQEGHLKSIDYYLSTSMSPTIPRQLAGFRAKELEEHADFFGLDWINGLHPTVDGYYWYRGYLVPTAEQIGTLILQPWIHPGREEGSPFPVAYTFGNPNIDDVRAVTADFSFHHGGDAVPTVAS